MKGERTTMGNNFLIREVTGFFARSGMTPVLVSLTFFFASFLFLSCTRDSGGDPGENLRSYCIRECVTETSDAEICDTKCKCAVEKLANDTGGEFGDIAKQIVENGPQAGEYIQKFGDAYSQCLGIK